MREILISFSVFIACLTMALISQIVSPTPIGAETLSTDKTTQSSTTDTFKDVPGVFELDPEDSNPSLFAMAVEKAYNEDSVPFSKIEMNAPKLTDSGLKITDLSIGEGPEATAGQKVTVNYRGSLENGKEFDTSYGRGPFSFSLGAGQVIKGWDEGVAGMRIGGKRKLVIPPELGYGSRGAGGVIPPNATLIFEVELIKIN